MEVMQRADVSVHVTEPLFSSVLIGSTRTCGADSVREGHMGMLDKVASIEGGLQFADRALRWGPVVAGAGGSAVLGGWAAQATKTFGEYAPASWVFGAMLGACLFLLAALVWYSMRIRAVHLGAAQELAKKADQINPLDQTFTRKRIRLTDSPTKYYGEIKGKTFVDCEIAGPAVVVMLGNGALSGVSLAACEFVAVKDAGAIYNAIPLIDVKVHGGNMRGITFFVHESLVPMVNQGVAGVRWVNI